MEDMLITMQKIAEKDGEIDMKDILIIIYTFAKINKEAIHETNIALQNLNEACKLLNNKVNALKERVEILEEMI